MTPDQALAMLASFTGQLESEFKTTCRVIAAVPTDKGDYKPAPASMSALELCRHIASSDVWFLESVAAGEFTPPAYEGLDSSQTSADILAWYQEHFAAAIAKVKAMSGEQCAQVVNFHDVFQYPAVFFLNFDLLHTVHHRGQLSVYLRPMGAKVPSIYGGSADEPFQMPAAASA